MGLWAGRSEVWAVNGWLGCQGVAHGKEWELLYGLMVFVRKGQQCIGRIGKNGC